MSTAVYYTHNMPGDDLQSTRHNNNTLPSLAQIMPSHAQQQDSGASAAAAAGTSPVVNGYYPQQQSYVQDAYSQASTSQTTPSTSYADHTTTSKSKAGNSTRSSVSSSTTNNTNANGAQCICKTRETKFHVQEMRLFCLDKNTIKLYWMKVQLYVPTLKFHVS